MSPAYSAAASGTSPCFGGRCAIATIVTPLVLLGLSFVSDFQSSASDFRPVMGLVYGLATAWCWTLTLIEGRFFRLLIGLAIVTLLSVFAATTFDAPFLRYWINMAGMVLVQSVLFWLARMPHWRTRGSAYSIPKQQFQILDILLITTALAALLTMARRYETPVASNDYWQVMVGVWIWLPALAATVCLSTISKRWHGYVSWSVASIALVVGGAIALAALDPTLQSHDVRLVAARYGAIALAYAVVWWTFGWAARQDAIIDSRDRQDLGPASA